MQPAKDEPIALYKEKVEAGVVDPLPYTRLMIHYRREKDYAAELKVIKKAIDTFKKFYGGAAVKRRGKIAELSEKISRSTGLTDKKGQHIYFPEPIPQWIKRQATVEQKLKKKK